MNSISSSSSSPLPTLFSQCNFSNNSSKSQLSLLSLPSSKLRDLNSSVLSIFRIFAASEVLESDVNTASFEDEAPGNPVPSVGADSDKMAPIQKIRIKLRSYWVPLIEDSCKQIMDTARTIDQCKDHGSNKEENILCSENLHKDARFHFEN